MEITINNPIPNEKKLLDKINNLFAITFPDKSTVLLIKILQNAIRTSPMSDYNILMERYEYIADSSEYNQQRLRIEKSGLPEKYIDIDIYQFPHYIKQPNKKHFINEVANFKDNINKNKGKCFTMIGNPGTGKSSQAGAILQAGLNVGLYGKWINNYSLFEDVKTGKASISNYTKYSIIVFDEFLNKQTPALVEFYSNIVEQLVIKKSIVILTSNYEIPKSEDMNIKTIYDRLNADGNIFLNLNWESLR